LKVEKRSFDRMRTEKEPVKKTEAGDGASEEGTQYVSRKVLIPVDESEYSRHAVKWAAKNALRSEDRVTLLHVAKVVPFESSLEFASYCDVPNVNPILFTGPTEKAEDKTESATRTVCQQAEVFMMDLKKVAVDDGVAQDKISFAVFPYGMTDNHDVGECIVEHVQKHGADMVVMGTRGLSAVRSSLLGLVGLGSVSNYVAHHLACPVTLVRPPRSAAEGDAS